MERLTDISTFVVQQKAFMGEVLTRYEVENEYMISTESGEELLYAQEHSSNYFIKMYLRSMRPFEMAIIDNSGQAILNLKRPFKFYYHELFINDASGNRLGRIKKEFSFLERIYYIYDEDDKELYRLYGPILRPWTFLVKFRGNEIGKITKKWSGMAKEMFTNADNFSLSIPKNMQVEHKAILLGAIFLIDFVHFENKGK